MSDNEQVGVDELSFEQALGLATAETRIRELVDEQGNTTHFTAEDDNEQ